MKGLTKKERGFLEQSLNGEEFGQEAFDAMVKASNEGRIKEDDSEIARRWRERYKLTIARALVGNLIRKRKRNYYLPKDDQKILQDFEEKGILPEV